MKKKTLSGYGKFLLWNYTNDASTMSRSYWLQQLAFKRYRPLPPPPPAPSPFTLPLHPPPDWCCLSSPLYSHIPPPLSTALTETRIKRILRTRISNSNMCVSRIIGLTQSLDIWVTRRGRRCCCCWRVASAFWWNGRTVVSGRERRWNMILYWIICFFSVWASIKCASRVSKKSILLSNIKKIWVFQIHQNVFISNVWCQYVRMFDLFSQFLWALCDA